MRLSSLALGLAGALISCRPQGSPAPAPVIATFAEVLTDVTRGGRTVAVSIL